MKYFSTIACVLVAWPSLAAAAKWPIPQIDPQIMNTISTFQKYGPRIGFHHGLDLRAPAGSTVIAPASGDISLGSYYERGGDYTYEVAIETESGHLWELHHVDPDTIPETVRVLAEKGGTISAGTPIGSVYDASPMGIRPHIHINVMSSDGRYVNPLRFLENIDDKRAPVIRETYFAERKKRQFETIERDTSRGSPELLVVDAYDLAPGDVGPQSVYGLEVLSENRVIKSFEFDRLPHKDYMQGVDDVYLTEPLETDGGKTLQTGGKLEDRRFLYAVELPDDIFSKVDTIEVRLRDHHGNWVSTTLGR